MNTLEDANDDEDRRYELRIRNPFLEKMRSVALFTREVTWSNT